VAGNCQLSRGAEGLQMKIGWLAVFPEGHLRCCSALIVDPLTNLALPFRGISNWTIDEMLGGDIIILIIHLFLFGLTSTGSPYHDPSQNHHGQPLTVNSRPPTIQRSSDHASSEHRGQRATAGTAGARGERGGGK
jgi:hypothetical protein